MARFKLNQLETFHWLCELGSFRATARRLNMTQPAVSARIRELERSLGARLFDRQARGTPLTVEGRELVGYAARMLELSALIEHRVGARAEAHGLVRLGVVDTVAITWLPTLISRLEMVYPELHVELEVDLTIHLTRKLAERQVDLAFLVGPVPGPNVAVEPLGTVSLAWMASPRIVLARGPLRPADLVDRQIIAHSRGSHHHALTEEWFRRDGAEPRRISGCSSLATIIKLTCSGLGISILAPATVGEELKAGRLRMIPTDRPLPRLSFVAAYHRGYGERLARSIAELGREVAGEDEGFDQLGPT